MKTLLIAISALLLLPNFIHTDLEKKPRYNHKELFNPSLAYINSIAKLINVSDSIAAKNNITQGSLKYAITVSTVIRKRFYHGFSRYNLNENWIAAMGEKVFGYGLASIVKPDDILKYSYGACSQQSIVLMEAMKRKNIDSRCVGFPHHYATELKIGGSWFFFDPDMEPNIPDSARLESKWNCCADKLKKYYDRARYPDLDFKFGNNLTTTVGKVNAAPAPNAMLFQNTTKYLSKILWLFPLSFIFYRGKNVKPQF